MVEEARSIHYRRRWFYVLWSGLLLVSLAALTLWEIPSGGGRATLQVQVAVLRAPHGCRVQVWAGPEKNWRGKLSGGPEVMADQTIPEDGKVVVAMELPVAYRRWVRQYISRKTADLVVLVFAPTNGPPRYQAFHLDTDWRTGLLRPGRSMKLSLNTTWEGLWRDPLTLPDTP